MSVSIRKVEEPVYDGSTGSQIDTHTRYEIGGEIEGTFVPFANVRESYVTHLQDLDKRAKEKAAKEQPSAATTSETADTGAPQSPAVPTAGETTSGETSETQ